MMMYIYAEFSPNGMIAAWLHFKHCLSVRRGYGGFACSSERDQPSSFLACTTCFHAHVGPLCVIWIYFDNKQIVENYFFFN
jgi:hypothetical protein